jgi:hypothetical protein
MQKVVNVGDDDAKKSFGRLESAGVLGSFTNVLIGSACMGLSTGRRQHDDLIEALSVLGSVMGIVLLGQGTTHHEVDYDDMGRTSIQPRCSVALMEMRWIGARYEKPQLLDFFHNISFHIIVCAVCFLSNISSSYP